MSIDGKDNEADGDLAVATAVERLDCRRQDRQGDQGAWREKRTDPLHSSNGLRHDGDGGPCSHRHRGRGGIWDERLSGGSHRTGGVTFRRWA